MYFSSIDPSSFRPRSLICTLRRPRASGGVCSKECTAVMVQDSSTLSASKAHPKGRTWKKLLGTYGNPSPCLTSPSWWLRSKSWRSWTARRQRADLARRAQARERRQARGVSPRRAVLWQLRQEIYAALDSGVGERHGAEPRWRAAHPPSQEGGDEAAPGQGADRLESRRAGDG